MKFRSYFIDRGSFNLSNTTFDKDCIRNEPMFYRASIGFAKKNGGPITNTFIDNLPPDWKNLPLTVDTRVHMLMPGWYPCIPGMHHDDIPRTRCDKQPNYLDINYNADHIMGLVNGDIAPTEFAIGDIDLAIPPVGELIYKVWHPKIIDAISTGNLKSVKIESYRYIQFDNFAFHQGTKAVKPGWRWFIRVSRNTNRATNCKNEIRKQVQVYMENPVEGW